MKKTKGVAADVRKFSGFAPNAMDFFRRLRNNNEREWFAGQKATYEETLVAPMQALVFELADRLSDLRIPIEPNRKSAVMRIYRDVRFSANKTPYKTAISAYLRRGGEGVHSGGIFLQFSDKERFVGMGFWLPERELLHAWREAIASRPKEFLKMDGGRCTRMGIRWMGKARCGGCRAGLTLMRGRRWLSTLKLTSFFVMKGNFEGAVDVGEAGGGCGRSLRRRRGRWWSMGGRLRQRCRRR